MDRRPCLLAVDDDELVLRAIEMAVPPQWTFMGFRQSTLVPPQARFDAAFVDMHLTGNIENAEGLKVVEKLSVHNPHAQIVAISGNLDRDLMENCLRAGASRFLAKPLSAEEITLTLGKIEALLLLQNSTARSSSDLKWIGASSASQEIIKQMAMLKGESGPILIEGESGTGKEIVSRLLNQQESRGPFIQLNIAAIPEALFESEMFGHVRGAFTGADQNKMGLAEAAHGGDLFLDEVEALSLSSQVKLLRFLETGEVRRVGAKETIHVKTRVIAATNQPLEDLVKKEKFREDLLWRLSGKKIRVPPLRARPSDIDELARFFLEQEKPRRNKTLAPEALQALRAYDWPGNVRELRRVLEQVSLTSPLPIIRDEDVVPLIRPAHKTPRANHVDLTKGLPTLIEEFERFAIVEGLKFYKDVDETARHLKISRSSMYKKMKDYGIDATEPQ